MENVIADLYETYGESVFGFCLKFVRQRALAQDLRQEVFIHVMRGWPDFKGEGSVKGWIFAIARNVCRSHYQKAGREASKRERFVLERVTGRIECSEDLSIARMVFQKTLSRVNRRTRDILWKFYVEGKIHQEIAVETGISRVAVTRTLTRVSRNWCMGILPRSKRFSRNIQNGNSGSRRPLGMAA